ncbi:DUF2252 domain-containing protein [Kitasatospora sp. NBC_00240]|uniref:DUF2252 domain-containing protein n=1 Tax=Kitasatospora sp. NBC_00240 TaxID=2903567 RepID=UPI00224CB121|nr:DUF2252 domain-containing protein [Kitasatospora sp. NBC_00240]MCX5214998.1 DUF2252 domain-containing protein [Kitasatospora sp. NBC_00240]
MTVTKKSVTDGNSDAGASTRGAAPELLSRADRVASGKAARRTAPLEAHGEFRPDRSRDPVGLLLGQAASRVPELVPVRHGRMLVSPFTYYRGAALPMAADLAATPTSGLRVQLCGDAHLANFGAFASPERRLVFDVNDFDETLPGPFEWDVKRLAASLVVAGRDNDFSHKARRRIVLEAAKGYRKAMRQFAKQPFLEVWYAHLDIEEAIEQFRSQIKAKRFRATEELLAKAHTRDSTQALGKLTTLVDGRRRIISAPPTIVPVEELFGDVQSDEIYKLIRTVLGKYRRTLQTDRQHLLDHFTLVQMARKVVGVGSVGTRAWIVLMDGGDGVEPLFLQAKEAQPSVLAEYAGSSRYGNEGERVVAGQHLMQAQSDIFLGWTRVTGPDKVNRDFYVRQLRDWKFSAPIEMMLPSGMAVYGRLCGWTLARAHARTGDRVALAAYLGGSDRFDQAVADFAEAYADQNEEDFAALQLAVVDGRAEATSGI